METDEGRRAAVSDLVELWSANHVEIVGLGAARQDRGQGMPLCDVDVGVMWMGRIGRDGGEERSGWGRMKRLVECKDRIRDKVTRRPTGHNRQAHLRSRRLSTSRWLWLAVADRYEVVVDPSCVPTIRSLCSLTAVTPA